MNTITNQELYKTELRTERATVARATATASANKLLREERQANQVRANYARTRKAV